MPTAKTIQDVILGEAGGFNPEDRFEDMLAIASVIQNRANEFGVSPQDVISVQSQFNAFGKSLPAGAENFRALADRAWQHVQTVGPVIPSTFYATTKTARHLPNGLRFNAETKGHQFFHDPRNREVLTAKGYKTSNRPHVPQPPFGNVTFVHGKRQDNMRADSMAILQKTARDMRTNLTLQSGYRHAGHKSERNKNTPGEHNRRTAADIVVAGKSDEWKGQLVETLIKHGGKRFISYGSKERPGSWIHFDLGKLGRTSEDDLHFMHNSSAANMQNAPDWFQDIAGRFQTSPPAGSDIPTPTGREEAIAQLTPSGPGLGQLIGYNSRGAELLADAQTTAASDPITQAGAEMAFADPVQALEAAGLIGGEPLTAGVIGGSTEPVPKGSLEPTPVRTTRERSAVSVSPELASAFPLGTGVTPTDVSGSFRGKQAGAIGQGPSSPTAKSLDPQPIQVASLGNEFPVPSLAPRETPQAATGAFFDNAMPAPVPATPEQAAALGLSGVPVGQAPGETPQAPEQTPANGLFGSPEAFASQKAPKHAQEPVGAFGMPQSPLDVATKRGGQEYGLPPVPGLQPSSPAIAETTPGEFGFDAAQEERGAFGFDAVPANQLGNPPRSTAGKIGRAVAPLAAGAIGGPLAGLAIGGAMRQAERIDSGYFPDAPRTGGGLFGNLFGSAPVTGESKTVADILKSGPGSASYGGKGMSSIQGVMSSTGPGVANPDIGTVAESRSNPGFSVVGLGPVGYGRQSSKFGWAEVVGPIGTSFHPGKQFATTVDPATGRKSVSLVAIGNPSKRSVIAATRGPGRGPAIGHGLASLFSSLFGPVTTTPAPAIGPEATSFGPGPTTGPTGFSPGGAIGGAGFGNMGFGVGFGGFGGIGGAHSNSSDSRGL